MQSAVESSLYWNYWATVVYILGMFGYLTIDTTNYIFTSFNESLSRFIYIFLAILFVIDAIFYAISWYMYAVKSRENENEPIHYRIELIACIFQHLGSYLYLIGALLAFQTNQFLATVLLLHFLGILAFVIESCLTFLAWRLSVRNKPSIDPKRGCVSQDVFLWAHTINIIASLIYLCGTSLAYRIYIHLMIIYPSGVLMLYILGDLLYLFDAYLYYECWQRDKQDHDANIQRQKIMKLDLVRQFTIEDTLNDEQ